MRYRKLSPTGDYVFGQGSANFLIDSAACVAQSILTRMRLWRGEWFLDIESGTPWETEVLSGETKNTTSTYDRAIRDRVLRTEGVVEIASYESQLDTARRSLRVTMDVNTVYGLTGPIPLVVSLP